MVPTALLSTPASTPAPSKRGQQASASTEQQSLSSFADYHLDYTLWDTNDPTSESSQRFVASLRLAMVGIGFFYLHGTSLDAKRQTMFDFVSRFFQLPLEERLKIDMNNSRNFRSYCNFGDERTVQRQDLRDQVDYAPEMQPIQDAALLEKHPFLNLYGPNQFVSDEVCEGQRRIVLNWFKTANEVSNQLTRAIELALGVDEGELSQFLTGETKKDQRSVNVADPALEKLGPLPYARMKTIRYPTGNTVDGVTRSDPASTQGVGAHKRQRLAHPSRSLRPCRWSRRSRLYRILAFHPSRRGLNHCQLWTTSRVLNQWHRSGCDASRRVQPIRNKGPLFSSFLQLARSQHLLATT